MADAPHIPDEAEVRARWGGMCYALCVNCMEMGW